MCRAHARIEVYAILPTATSFWWCTTQRGKRTMRLERFTDKAQEAFQEAQEIMHEQHHTQLDVEHIFLAMLRQKDGLASRALDRLGVDPDTISQRVERELEKSPKDYGQHGYGNQGTNTPRTQRLVKRAGEDAPRLPVQFADIDQPLIALSGD